MATGVVDDKTQGKSKEHMEKTGNFVLIGVWQPWKKDTEVNLNKKFIHKRVAYLGISVCVCVCGGGGG